MNENIKQKIMKTILSLMISFLIIFIAAMFARAASNTILPENNVATVFINDYLDMMMQRVDKIAVKMKIKRNSVSEYQVNLITQSISDYVGYSMYQTADSLKDFNPNKNVSKTQLDKYKNGYYKMTLENPYLRGMTVFNTDGKMLLNLYMSRNKSWPLELQDNLVKEIKTKGSLVLNATNENTFYIMEYIKNPYGEIIVSTRNDYAYVSDIAMYYQVADKRLYISDARNSVYNVRGAVGDNNIEKVSSVINKYAYYKKQPSFTVNDSLSVSMIGKEYPNYFELIVLAITALLILACKLLIKAIAYFFKYIIQVKNDKDYIKSIKGNDELINKNIINSSLPKSNPIEEMPPIIEKVHYKVPEQYLKENSSLQHKDNFNIGKNIMNIVSAIKEEINLCRDKLSESKKDLENKENASNNNDEASNDNMESAFAGIKKDLMEEYKRSIEESFFEDNIYNTEENIYIEDIKISDKENNDNIEELEDNIVEEEKLISVYDQLKNNSSKNNFIVKDLSSDENMLKNENNSKYKEYNNFDKKIVKSDLLSNYKEEKKEYAESLFKYSSNDYSNISIDILNSYNKAIDNIKTKNEKEESRRENTKPSDLYGSSNSRTDDVFAAFDKMLSSIINKAEEDAKKSITKK